MAGGTVVSAIIRRGDDLLMVCQQGPDDPEPYWFVPGGRVESGELLHEALAREVLEETGLAVVAPGHLAWVSQHHRDDPTWGGVWTAFAFDLPDPGGDPAPQDPDGLVQSAEWVPLPVALDRLRALPIRPMRDPVVAYLEGTGDAGTLWLWRLASEPDAPLLTLPAGRPAPAS